MTDKLMVLFQDHLKSQHDFDYVYPYQLEVARKIFDALISNLRLTTNADKYEVQDLKQVEVAVEFSRQSGKTTTLVHVVEFIMLFFPKLFDRKIEICLFAPQREQAKTDFDRLKTALRRTNQLLVISEEAKEEAKEESNSRTIVIANGKGASCHIAPVTSTSKPESKSPDLILFEESQDLEDKIVKEQIWPMGKFTNAPRIYVGTAGVQICHFYRLTQTSDALILDFDQIAAQKQEAYRVTGNPLHLIYVKSVQEDITKYGRDADEIRRPYYLEWIIGTGQFTTQADLETMIADRKATFHEKKSECFAGIDTAKNPDSTVVTILRYNPEIKRKEVLNWLELNGDNYKNQFDIIVEFLKNYNIIALAIDSTGQGDFMPDMFEVESEWRDEFSGLYRVKFSAVSKDMIYKNLKVSIRELLTTIPKLDTRKGEKFKEQMLDLQQEYKGQLLSVHHPDNANAHDDYPDSWALAEWAYARWNEDNNASVSVVTAQKERKVAKNEDTGAVEDYWPGIDS